MGKVLVYLYENMADFEITFVAHLINGVPEKEVIYIADEDKILKASSGMKYYPSATIAHAAKLDDIEGLIIPGGWNDGFNQELLKLIKELHNQEKLVAAICAGPQFLARAGILEQKKYTTSLTEWTEEEAKRFGDKDPFPRENFINTRIVRDDNVITSMGYAFVDFAIEICDWFNLFDNEEDRKQFEGQIKGLA